MTDEQFGSLCQRLDGVSEKVSRIDLILTGNGDPKKGMVVRFDRVEEKIRKVTWVAKTLFYVVAAAIFGLLADLIIKAVSYSVV
jgi:hypothetical protein